MARTLFNTISDATKLRKEIERERTKVRALQEIGIALSSTLDLSELLALILDRISDVMEADRSTLYLLDEATNELVSEVAQGADKNEIRLQIGEGLAGHVAKSGEALNIEDAYKDPRFDAEWDRRTGYRTSSTLCVPMKNQHGRIIGVVQVLNKHDGAFGADDAALLAALASQAAVSIENSKLFLSVVGKNVELLEIQEQLEDKLRELDVLFEIAQVAASATELDELLPGVLRHTIRAVEAEAAAVLLADEATGTLRFRAAVGGEPERVKEMTIKAGQGICGWVATNGQAQIVNDVENDERHSTHVSKEVGYHPKSILCVPLRWEGGIGAVQLLNKAHGTEPFTQDDLKLATVIAGQVSIAIEQAQFRERRARQDRLSTLGKFLSSMLHDLKTPLTVISGYSRLLVSEQDVNTRTEHAETIARQVQLMKSMTKETLAFARGERKCWIRKVYVHEFFRDLAQQLETVLAEYDVELELLLEDRSVAYFDEEKIQRVFHNLARNAAEAIEGPGGRCTLRVARGDQDALTLSFYDNGPGISEEIRERLFESFATYGKQGGTGLGLALVRQVIEDHGGSIEVESRPGHTEFKISLPSQGEESGTRP